MRFSVALCTYNGESFLAEQLASLEAQTRLPDELVICDDHSSDKTLDIAEDFKSKVRFPVRIVRNENQLGYIPNFEQAVSLSTGDAIALCDQDDVWYPQKLARFTEVFDSDNRIGLVFCDGDVVGPDLSPRGYSMWQHFGFTPAKRRRMEAGQAFEILLRRSYVSGLAMAFRASFRGLVLPFHPKWGHDNWITILIAAAGHLQPLPEKLVSYRQHDRNIRGATSSKIGAVERASTAARRQFHKSALKYGALHERLAQLEDRQRREYLLSMLTGKIAHLEARAGMSPRRSKRLPVIVAETLNGNYSRYARRGLVTALRDVLW
jgi:glycosyltransferase involved in cell wall biosynthesis